MTPGPDTCELCGKPSCVHFSKEGPDGPVTLRHLCGDCADRHPFDGMSGFDDAPRRRASLANLITVLGAAFAMMALSADYLRIGGEGGFGWRQKSGVLLGAAVTLIGAIFRVDVLAVCGAALFVFAGAADWLGFGEGSGISTRQEFALLLAAGMVFAGLYVRHRRRGRR